MTRKEWVNRMLRKVQATGPISKGLEGVPMTPTMDTFTGYKGPLKEGRTE